MSAGLPRPARRLHQAFVSGNLRFVNVGLVIAATCLAIIAIAALAWRRYAEKAAQRRWAAAHGWSTFPRGPETLPSRLRGAALFSVGHSRRIDGLFCAPGPMYLFNWLCETGFEHRRLSHRWTVVALEAPSVSQSALVTTQAWLAAAAEAPGRHILPMTEETKDAAKPAEGGRATPWLAVVEDADRWRPLIHGALARWLRSQPPERSWETVPGLVLVHEPGEITDQSFSTMSAAVREFCRLIQPLTAEAQEAGSAGAGPVGTGSASAVGGTSDASGSAAAAVVG